MSTTTTNLGLIKPEKSDNYSVDVMGENMDIIDGKIAKLEAGEFETVNCAGTIVADEFVGGVGNFTSLELANGIDGKLIKMPTLSYEGYYTTAKNGGSAVNYVTLFSTPFPISGVVSVRAIGMAASNPPLLVFITTNGKVTHNLTSVQTEYTVSNAFLIYCLDVYNGSEFSVGVPKLV